MAGRPLQKILDHVHGLATAGACSASPDRELLERFAARRDEAAFAALVERHGAMVLRVCRRVLANRQDAEDACQATFLILARRAGSIRKGQSLGCWLYAVARRAALRLRQEVARRQAREGPCLDPPQAGAEPSWREVLALLDEELQRLPDKYRAPLLLCYLEGKTYDEAGTELSLSPAAIRGRLERGRERLRARLVRRGVAFPAALLVTALAEGAGRTAVPPALVVQTVRAAGVSAAGPAATAGVVSATVAALTEGVLKAMLLKKIKVAVAVLLVAALVCLGVGALLQSAGAAPEQGPPPQAKEGKGDQPARVAEKGKPVQCMGQITDQATGKPVAGATVAFYLSWDRGRSPYLASLAYRLIKHQTAADGKYRFTVPRELRKHKDLRISVQVGHPDFVARNVFWAEGPDFRPQGSLDAQLDPGEAITGTVRTPDGKPAAGVEVVAESRKPRPKQWTPENLGPFWTHARTDAQGRFRLKLATPGPAVFWILSDKHAPSEHRLNDKERGDRGMFTLKPGLSLAGKVLDAKGKPLPGVNVNAWRMEVPERFLFLLGLDDIGLMGRSTVTNAKGEFTLGALAPGVYAVQPDSISLRTRSSSAFAPFLAAGERRERYPLPGFFVREEVTLKEGMKPQTVEIRPVPSVVIAFQFIDKAGKPIRGSWLSVPPYINAEFERKHCDRMPEQAGAGKWIARLPHGAEKVKLLFEIGEEDNLRYRLKKGDRLAPVRPVMELGTVIDDITIEFYRPPPKKGGGQPKAGNNP
jgi:RNA polymerase sigma factor (sigma-70 family)